MGPTTTVLECQWSLWLGPHVSAKPSCQWTSTQKLEKPCLRSSVILESIPKVPIFVSFSWLVALCSQGSELKTDSLAPQHQFGVSTLTYQGLSCAGPQSEVACQELAFEAYFLPELPDSKHSHHIISDYIKWFLRHTKGHITFVVVPFTAPTLLSTPPYLCFLAATNL